MKTFLEWLSDLKFLARLQLLETYFTFDPAQYNALFEDELEKLLQRVTDPAHRQVLERSRGFNWVGYVAQSVRRSGPGHLDQREVQERTHDIVVNLLMGKLFSGFDERTSGPMDLRFKTSVANGIRNIIEKQRNRRRNLPTAAPEYEPAARSSPIHDDETVIEQFRRLLQNRLGDLAVAIFDLRLNAGETKSLIGSPSVGSPSGFAIKKTVQQIKALAQEFAQQRGDAGFLRDIERAMDKEAATVQKRVAARRTA